MRIARFLYEFDVANTTKLADEREVGFPNASLHRIVKDAENPE
jgi:hypothetical protein